MKDMKMIEIEIPEGKKAEWVGGVLTLVDDKTIEHKFKVGDRVTKIGAPLAVFTIAKRETLNGEPYYSVAEHPDCLPYKETELTLYAHQSIIERIKTFEDACEWCRNNGHNQIVRELSRIGSLFTKERINSPELFAYLKLRIINAALNEGWEPPFDGRKGLWSVYYDEENCCISSYYSYEMFITKVSVFKSSMLSRYAAKQFRDIYADFCGCKKGGEK